MPDPLGSGPSPDELRDRIDQGAPEAPTDPKRARVYTFDFKHQTPDGFLYEGRFQNRVLTVGDRIKQGVLFSDLINNRPRDSVSNSAVQLAQAVSWMTYSISREMRPEWASDLGKVEDEDAVFALFAEVWSHQCTFLGRSHVAPQSSGSA